MVVPVLVTGAFVLLVAGGRRAGLQRAVTEVGGLGVAAVTVVATVVVAGWYRDRRRL